MVNGGLLCNGPCPRIYGVENGYLSRGTVLSNTPASHSEYQSENRPAKRHQLLNLSTIHLSASIIMHSFYLLALFPFSAMATLNGHCTGADATGDWGEYGICIYTSTCADYNGATTNGACPDDPDDIKCCLIGVGPSVSDNPCGGSSYCDWTSNGCEFGNWVAGELCHYLTTFFVDGRQTDVPATYRILSRIEQL